MMAPSDELLESIYDLVHRQPTETARTDTARIALLAGQYRANKRKQQAIQRALDKVLAERKALKASSRDTADYIADPAGRLSPARPGGEGSDQ